MTANPNDEGGITDKIADAIFGEWDGENDEDARKKRERIEKNK